MKQVTKEQYEVLRDFGITGEIRYFVDVPRAAGTPALVAAVTKPKKSSVGRQKKSKENLPVRLTQKGQNEDGSAFFGGSKMQTIFNTTKLLLADAPKETLGRVDLSKAVAKETGFRLDYIVHPYISRLVQRGYLTVAAPINGTGHTNSLLALGENFPSVNLPESVRGKVVAAMASLYTSPLTQYPRKVLVEKLEKATGLTIDQIQPVLSNLLTEKAIRPAQA